MGRTRRVIGRKSSEVALLTDHNEERVNRQEYGPTPASWEKCPSSSWKPLKKQCASDLEKGQWWQESHTLQWGKYALADDTRWAVRQTGWNCVSRRVRKNTAEVTDTEQIGWQYKQGGASRADGAHSQQGRDQILHRVLEQGMYYSYFCKTDSHFLGWMMWESHSPAVSWPSNGRLGISEHSGFGFWGKVEEMLTHYRAKFQPHVCLFLAPKS